MPSPDRPVSGSTDIWIRSPSVTGVGLAGVVAMLTMFVIGVALTTPPVEAAIIAVLYALVLTIVLGIVCFASRFFDAFRRLE